VIALPHLRQKINRKSVGFFVQDFFRHQYTIIGIFYVEVDIPSKTDFDYFVDYTQIFPRAVTR